MIKAERKEHTANTILVNCTVSASYVLTFMYQWIQHTQTSPVLKSMKYASAVVRTVFQQDAAVDLIRMARM